MPMSKMTAGVLGAVYTVLGVLGFISPLTSGDNLFGIFPVSPAHNLAYLLIGLTGLAVYLAMPAMSRTWVQVWGIVLALLAIAGIVVANPGGGFPIGGANILLHAVSAAVLLYVGFLGTKQETATA